MPPPPRTPALDLPPGARFRNEIAAALEGGQAHEGLVLHLSRTDVSRLKRDSGVPLDAISFGSGEMRYLGVRVREGGSGPSRLGSADEPDAAAEKEAADAAPAKPKKAVAKKTR